MLGQEWVKDNWKVVSNRDGGEGSEAGQDKDREVYKIKDKILLHKRSQHQAQKMNILLLAHEGLIFTFSASNICILPEVVQWYGQLHHSWLS
jgi:hypothetical protein